MKGGKKKAKFKIKALLGRTYVFQHELLAYIYIYIYMWINSEKKNFFLLYLKL